ncbi:hypothetical protein ACS0TY_026172 [Phlomoides rotata]
MAKDNAGKKRDMMVERARLERERKAKAGASSPAVAKATKRAAVAETGDKPPRKKKQLAPTNVVQALEATPLPAFVESPSPAPREKGIATSPERNPLDKTFLGWEPTRADKALKSKGPRATFVMDYMASTELDQRSPSNGRGTGLL